MDCRSSMESSETLRNKCAACYKQFNKLEHLVEHMKISYHSGHEPMCGVCKKHCRSFESLREHLIGPLPKQECKNIFSFRGCRFCLMILETPNARRIHQERCQFSSVNAGLTTRMAALGVRDKAMIDYTSSRSPKVVALSCKMVGGGSDGSLDLCGREEDELDTMPGEIYCPWTPARSPVEMTSPCRKSKSTGSSSTSTWSRRRWRIRNLLTRSRSDGKETLEFLNTSPVDNIDKSCSSSPCPKNKETVKTKSKKKEKEKISVSAHEKFYLRNKAMKEEDKRKSYLSYKQEFVGLFSNIHRHGKVSSPF
ncbi:unnamed protein product [Brassica oleracea]|nr:unnamed protein product [Brassica napus]